MLSLPNLGGALHHVLLNPALMTSAVRCHQHHGINRHNLLAPPPSSPGSASAVAEVRTVVARSLIRIILR
jgi:hypothetical protein